MKRRAAAPGPACALAKVCGPKPAHAAHQGGSCAAAPGPHSSPPPPLRHTEHDVAPRCCPSPAARMQGGEWAMSSWEQDEEIVKKLHSWTDSLMMRRFK